MNQIIKVPEKRNSSTKLPKEARRDRKAESVHWWDKQHSLVLRQTPRWAQGLTLALFLLGTGGIIAASTIKIDEVITVRGTLKPIGGIYELKTPAGGLIKQVLKNEGQYVEKGELIVQFDTRQAEDMIRNTKTQIQEIERAYSSTLRALNSRKTSIVNSLNTSQRILSNLEDLQAVGAIQLHKLLQQRNEVFNLQAQVEEINEQIIQNKSGVDRSLSDLKARLNQTKIQKQYEMVYAPISGTIFDMRAVDRGVLGGGEIISKIIPRKNLKGDIAVTNKDIGYIKENQKVQCELILLTTRDLV